MPVANPRFLLASLVVALLSALLFLPGLPGEFVFDDIPNIVNNVAIRLPRLDAAALVQVISAEQPSGNMRGLPTLTFALDYWRAGGIFDPATFKITGILIHALTAFALAGFFRALLLFRDMPTTRAQWAACALALTWAAHPLHVSSVLYVVQRMQTMGTLFLLLALLSYLRARQAQIQGRAGRRGLLVAALLWAVAMGCKEDSVLLPAYTLALELTVLRFAAADANVQVAWRRSYLITALAGSAAYLFLVIPAFWSWEPYPGRDFSTWERLLTQPRMLCLYLWQTLLPLPQHMPFYYDWVPPSRSLLQPWTTVIAIATVGTLLGLAWGVRRSQPLFALGIFLFFGAHLIASNIVGLELAFEHRNHFALIGAVMAAGSLLAQASQRLRLPVAAQAALCTILLVALCSATAMRAHSWRSNLTLAKAGTEAAPQSPRAWIELCSALLEAGGGPVHGNRHLDAAIRACSAGAAAAPDTLNSLALLVVLKTVRGDVDPSDWERFQQRLGTARMSWDNRRAPLIFTHYTGLGVKLDKREVLQALETLVRRAKLRYSTLAAIGLSVMTDLEQPGRSVRFFVLAVDAAPPGDGFAARLDQELRAMGENGVADALARRQSGPNETTGREARP